MNPDRDPALDALLRGHADETPPAHVDAAILAAAHRAVANARAAERSQAKRSWRWWMPLAAAAVIGTVVIGVPPLAPVEPDVGSQVARDAPVNAAPAARDGSRGTDAHTRKDGAAQRPREGRDARSPEARALVPERSSDAPPLERRAPAPAESTSSADAAARTKSSAPHEQPAPSASPADAKPIPMQEQRSAAAPALAPPPQNFGTTPLAEPAPTGTPAPSLADARRADDWVARIRALRSEGRVSEAKQELARFRSAFNDADARLPADLRGWADSLPH